MIDFSLYFVGSWKAGETPKADKANVMVNYDQKTYAYLVEDEEFKSFLDWAAIQWEDENQPIGDSEEAKEYLDRIGVYVEKSEVM